MNIHEFEKNTAERVRISINEYQGNRYVDIRVMYDASQDENPEWRFSPKGITVALDLLPELKKGVDMALAKVEFEDN